MLSSGLKANDLSGIDDEVELDVWANSSKPVVTDKVDVDWSQWRTKNEQPLMERLKEHKDCPGKKLTIHYTATPKNKYNLKQKLRNLFDFSTTKKNWGDIPYNYYIDELGVLARGRSTKYQPDTNTKYNPNCHITIVVEGNDEVDPAKKITFSSKQKKKLFTKMQELQKLHKVPTADIGVHNDYANTSCPGNEIKAAVQDYKNKNPLGL